ncbi:GroES-like protein [Flagelloscypha sp. PMI_526]|nr:GroES-like protein [Flagelloscypha sp. PMI_526]
MSLSKQSYSTLIAFDTYTTDFLFGLNKDQDLPVPLSISASGHVKAVGEKVDKLKAGDAHRLPAFCFPPANRKGKAMQELFVADQSVLAKFRLSRFQPGFLSLHAATLPDNFITAFYTLFNQLSLPWSSTIPSTTPVEEPVLVYGAASSSGIYTVQLLRIAGFTNIYAVASERNHDLSQSSRCNTRFQLQQYRCHDTITALGRVVDDNGGEVAVLLPIKEGNSVRSTERMTWEVKDGLLPKGSKAVLVRTFLYQNDKFMREKLMPEVLPELLEKGLIEPNRVKLLDQGSWLERVTIGLNLLRNNKVSGEKVVVKVPK